jgi:protoheme IX farnesyltransferase
MANFIIPYKQKNIFILLKPTILHPYLVLCKFKIAFWNGFAAAVTYVIARGTIDTGILASFCGVLILASGALILNQVQEISYDALMERTRMRPLPTGKISPQSALILLLIFILTGETILFLQAGALPAIFGMFAIVSYNFIYTPLKRKSLMIAIPSSLVGVFPPLIGWAAGGGSWVSSTIYAICVFFFFWQIPHFLLLYKLYHEDYKKAGFGIMIGLADEYLSKAIFIGILLSVLSAASFFYFGILTQKWVVVLFILSSGFMLKHAIRLVSSKKTLVKPHGVFIYFNLWVAALLFFMLLDCVLANRSPVFYHL